MFRRSPLGRGSGPTFEAGSAASIAGLPGARWKLLAARLTNLGSPANIPLPLVMFTAAPPRRLYLIVLCGGRGSIGVAQLVQTKICDEPPLRVMMLLVTAMLEPPSVKIADPRLPAPQAWSVI